MKRGKVVRICGQVERKDLQVTATTVVVQGAVPEKTFTAKRLGIAEADRDKEKKGFVLRNERERGRHD